MVEMLMTIAEETSEMIIANEKRLIKQARENL